MNHERALCECAELVHVDQNVLKLIAEMSGPARLQIDRVMLYGIGEYHWDAALAVPEPDAPGNLVAGFLYQEATGPTASLGVTQDDRVQLARLREQVARVLPVPQMAIITKLGTIAARMRCKGMGSAIFYPLRVNEDSTVWALHCKTREVYLLGRIESHPESRLVRAERMICALGVCLPPDAQSITITPNGRRIFFVRRVPRGDLADRVEMLAAGVWGITCIPAPAQAVVAVDNEAVFFLAHDGSVASLWEPRKNLLRGVVDCISAITTTWRGELVVMGDGDTGRLCDPVIAIIPTRV